MKIMFFAVLMLLFVGCISSAGRSNETAVEENITIEPEEPVVVDDSPRHFAGEFSFRYPSNMEVDEQEKLFTGTHDFQGQTYEVLVVANLDTQKTYGINTDKEYQLAPIKAATDFLVEDQQNDSAEILQYATEYGELSTYFIVRDAGVAEIPFKLKFPSSKTTYNGYAIDIYVPERSELIRARILAVDQKKADQIREQFLLTLRIESP